MADQPVDLALFETVRHRMQQAFAVDLETKVAPLTSNMLVSLCKEFILQGVDLHRVNENRCFYLSCLTSLHFSTQG